MTYDEVAQKLKGICETAGFSFHRDYETAQIPSKAPFPCFLGQVRESLCESAVTTDGKQRILKKKTEYSLELWGEGSELTEKSREIFKAIASEEGFEECTCSGISLSKVSRLPAAAVRFSVFETAKEAYSPISGELIVSCFDVKFSAKELRLEKGCYIPSVVLATGEEYRGEPSKREVQAVIRGVVPADSESAVRAKAFAAIGIKKPLTKNGSSIGELVAESVSVTASDSFFAEVEIKGRLLAGGA